MDSEALTKLHTTLQTMGFGGDKELLRVLLERGEAETIERRVLAWWSAAKTPMQHAALKSVYGHLRKHAMTVSTYDQADRLGLVLSRERGFRGVCLGRVEVNKEEVVLFFYLGDRQIGHRLIKARRRSRAANKA